MPANSANFDVKPTMVLEGTEYYSVVDSQRYVGLTAHGLTQWVNRWNEKHPKGDADHIIKYEFGGLQRFYRKEDLDKRFQMRPVE